jgi:hypothetical protein
MTQRDVPLKFAHLFINRRAVGCDGRRLGAASKFGVGECDLCDAGIDQNGGCNSEGYHGGRP